MAQALLVALLAADGGAQRATLRLVFGGDVIPHEALKHQARRRSAAGADGWAHVLRPLAPALGQADWAIVNLETPLTQAKRPERGDWIFSAGVDLARGLSSAGVNVVTFANNHALDQRRDGILSTRALAEDAGLRITGSAATEAEAWTPLVLERHGMRVGLLAFTRFLNGFHNAPDAGQPHVPLVHYPSDPLTGGLSEDELLRRVERAAGQVDVLIVVPHWGDEYQPKPKPVDVGLARRFAALGVFAVVGHHPHVVQPVELVPRPDGGAMFVAYSLGNLVSNQDAHDERSAKRDGALLELTLEREPDAGVRLAQATPTFLYTENRPAKAGQRDVQVRLLTDDLTAIAERLAEVSTRTTPAARQERKRLERKRALLQAREARLRALFVSPPTTPDAG